MSHKEIFTQLSLWTVNLYLKSYIFCLHFILLHMWSVDPSPNTDPDLDLKGSWIRIRIHNTLYQFVFGKVFLLLTAVLYRSEGPVQAAASEAAAPLLPGKGV